MGKGKMEREENVLTTSSVDHNGENEITRIKKKYLGAQTETRHGSESIFWTYFGHTEGTDRVVELVREVLQCLLKTDGVQLDMLLRASVSVNQILNC